MDKDILDQAREDFKRANDAEATQRKLSEECLRFGILGEQWPEEVKSQREAEGRPCLTINRLPAFLKQVTNDARMNRPTINVKPQGAGANEVTARIQTDLIRNIWTSSQGDICADTALDFAVAGGFGYMRVAVDYTCEDAFEQDILLERVHNPFGIYGDPDSKEATSIDWNVAFVTDWYSKARFQAKGWKWTDLTPMSFETDGEEDLWVDGDRVRVAEYWTRSEKQTDLVKLSDGSIMFGEEVDKLQNILFAQGITVEGTRPTRTYAVKQRIVTGKDIIEENDWAGKYIPIVPMYGEEWNIAGKRYFFGLFNRAMDPQRMFNYWRTASTELVALSPKAPWVGPVGAFATDAAKWATANVKSHPYIEFDIVPEAGPASMPQRQVFAGVPAGALQEAMNAADDMKAVTGLYDASLGARSNETSGVAINARQREGDTSTFNFHDNRNKAIEHVGRIILDLIPHVYTTDRILRCVQEDDSVYTVPVNQPVVHKAQFDALMSGKPPQQVQGQQQQEGPPQYVPAKNVPPELAQMLQGVTQVFDLTSGKYNVTVSTGPSFTTRREETASQMMEFIRVFPQAAPLIGDLLAKNLDWPGAEQVSARLKAMLPPQAQSQIAPIVQQLQQQLQQAHGQMQQMNAALNDKKREDAIKEFDAETKRIAAIVDAAEKGIIVSRDANGDMQANPIVPSMAMFTPPDPMAGGMPGMPPQGMPPQMPPQGPPMQQMPPQPQQMPPPGGIPASGGIPPLMNTGEQRPPM